MGFVNTEKQYIAAKKRYASLLGKFLDIDSQDYMDFIDLRGLILLYEHRFRIKPSTDQAKG